MRYPKHAAMREHGARPIPVGKPAPKPRPSRADSPERQIPPVSENSPIGIFDSGYGGLTVLREITKIMPAESTIFVGDTLHFPYGPRDLYEVRSFALDICAYLIERGCKLIVIACNTATAASLKVAQMIFNIPIIGVVEPGSRAATYMTRSRRVGVIATQGTVDSDAYPQAIHALDAGIEVISLATPELVDIAEAGIQFESFPKSDIAPDATAPLVMKGAENQRFDANDYVRVERTRFKPLRDACIDTLVLGCTHFPLIEPLIQKAVGKNVELVSSAEETAREVQWVLARRGELLYHSGAQPIHEYLITGSEVQDFAQFGETVMGEPLASVSRLSL